MARAESRLRAGAGNGGLAIIRARQYIGGTVGKGDKRTRRGKIYKGSYGKKRPHSIKKKKKKA